jgi:hypothetical protein
MFLLCAASIAEFAFEGFSKDVCRSMIAMLDSDHSGKLGFEEFKKLWSDIQTWKVRLFKFCCYFKSKMYLKSFHFIKHSEHI